MKLRAEIAEKEKYFEQLIATRDKDIDLQKYEIYELRNAQLLKTGEDDNFPNDDFNIGSLDKLTDKILPHDKLYEAAYEIFGSIQQNRQIKETIASDVLAFFISNHLIFPELNSGGYYNFTEDEKQVYKNMINRKF